MIEATRIRDVLGVPALRPAPDAWLQGGRRFRVAGCEIAAIVSPGAQPPVLFLHGNSSSMRVWANQFECMRRMGRAFIAIDLPGHGQSNNSSTPHLTYSFPGYAAVVREVLDALRCKSVDVVGWSLGGHVGLELLATDSRIRSLLISGTPPARPCAGAVERVFYSSESLGFASRCELSDADIVNYARAMMGGQAILTPELLQDIRRTDGWARQCMFENAVGGVGTDQQLTVETTYKPVCVVHGECDPFVRLDYLRSVSFSTLWSGHIHTIPAAGHAPQWQLPSAFNKILAGFLNSTNASTDRLVTGCGF